MRTLFIGAGAIGGTCAVLMKHAGFELDILEINEERAEDIRTNGIFLTGARGDYNEKFNAYSSVDQLSGQYDIVIIATKYQALVPVVKSVRPVMKDSTLTVCMQNGICTEMLDKEVPGLNIVGVMIGFGATGISPNHVRMTSLGELYIGMADGSRPYTLDYLKRMYDAVLPTTISDNILERLWSKLIINSCINSMAAVTGRTLGELADDPRALRIFLEIAREGYRTARALGINVPKYGKLLEYRMLMLSDAEVYNKICTLVVKAVCKSKYANVRPSTLQSLDRGEKTEIDIFNGYIARRAEEVGVKAPVCRILTDMIHAIERGELTSTPENLRQITF